MQVDALGKTELFTVVPQEEAWRRLSERITITGRSEKVPLSRALGRITAKRVESPGDLPAFARSAMDGYAVRAEDTYGASEGLPALLRVAGEVPMGREPKLELCAGQAVLIHTGGMLPVGADAVVMVENTQLVGDDVEVLRPVAPGENVVQVGEDVRKGETILPAGHLLRPQDLGALAATGIVELEVAARPRVTILATGDEVIPPEAQPTPGQVRDVNTSLLSGLVQRAGGEPITLGIVPDDYDALLNAAKRGLHIADALVVIAGSSVSTRDMTVRVIGELGEPGVLVHGVALRPGKPTILAVANGKPVFGLPGNPVSALVVAGLFVAPAIHRLAGSDQPRGSAVPAILTRNIPSATGREDYVPVRLLDRNGETWAEPVFGKSNLIFTTVRADAWVRVPLDVGGLAAGETVMAIAF